MRPDSASIEAGIIQTRQARHIRELRAQRDALRQECDDRQASLDAVAALLDHWIEAQGFDPCGGPVDDVDWVVVNACLVANGQLPHDHQAVLAITSRG